MIDPRGVEAARTLYGADGKLSEFTGADGRKTTFSYNHGPLSATGVSRQIATDDSGAQTATELDAQGNVVLVEQGRNLQTATRTVMSKTEREYDAKNNLTKEVVTAGGGTLTTERVIGYSSSNPNLPSSIETTLPGGAKTLERFNDLGQVTSSVDARNMVFSEGARPFYPDEPGGGERASAGHSGGVAGALAGQSLAAADAVGLR